MNKIVNIQIVIMFQELLPQDCDYLQISLKIKDIFHEFKTYNPSFVQGNTAMMPPEIPRFIYQNTTNEKTIQMNQNSVIFSYNTDVNNEKSLLRFLNSEIDLISHFITFVKKDFLVRLGIVLNGAKSTQKMLETLKTMILPAQIENFTNEESEVAFLRKHSINNYTLNQWTRYNYNKNQIKESQFYLFDFNTDISTPTKIENTNSLNDLYSDNFTQLIAEVFNER